MVVVFDLDDTLYDEVDFVRSGFMEIAAYLGDEKYYRYMMKVFESEGSGRVFDRLIEHYGLSTPLKKLIEIYRFHQPNIVLPTESIEWLLCANKNHHTALISDGHYLMQKNKFFALGLERHIDYPIFTDFYHTSKPERLAFKMVMDRYPEQRYLYISDNPQKDFIAPDRLGWETIRYKNPKGIYRNVFGRAGYETDDRREILHLIESLER